jgi:hypothetical protein
MGQVRGRATKLRSIAVTEAPRYMAAERLEREVVESARRQYGCEVLLRCFVTAGELGLLRAELQVAFDRRDVVALWRRLR